MPDSNHGLADPVRMGAVFDAIAAEIESWAIPAQEKGSTIVALAVQGVAERLRDMAGE